MHSPERLCRLGLWPKALLWAVLTARVFGGNFDRLWLEASINGQNTKLCFDSGSGFSAITPELAHRLGLQVIPSETNGLAPRTSSGTTELCTLSFGGAAWQLRFQVLDLPRYVKADFDGLVGWPVLSKSTFEISAVNHSIKFLKNGFKPSIREGWFSFKMVPSSEYLDLQASPDLGSNLVITVDTGSYLGLELSPASWSQWKQANPKTLLTLGTSFSPRDGFFVYEEAWADHFAFGGMILEGVPIESAGPGDSKRLGPLYGASLGIAALKRLNIVVDGQRKLVFLRPEHSKATSYPHNRLGAVFVPSPDHPKQAVACVVPDSPAFDAGVRNGDVLLQVDDVVVQSWNESWLSKLAMPAGTNVRLKLRRDGVQFETTATLHQLVGPQ